jgi:hypothetical protein
MMKNPLVTQFDLVRGWIRSCYGTSQLSICESAIELFERNFKAHPAVKALAQELYFEVHTRREQLEPYEGLHRMEKVLQETV